MGGKGSTISTSEQRILSLQVQQSSYGLALPIVFGQSRISGNLIDYTDFAAIATTTTTRSGGKGGGGKVTQKDTTYTYEAAVIMALCHGPIVGVPSYWRDKERRYGLHELGLTLFHGTHEQQPWAWMQGKHPERALGYSDTAYVASPAYNLGSNAQIPNHTFEIAGLLQVGSGVVDADPGRVLPELLTNTAFGASFPVTRLHDMATYSAYCRATGIVLSPVLQEQAEAREHIDLILQQTNSAPVWSAGKLKIVPYGDEAIVANGASYTPNLTPVYDLTDDDFIVGGEAADPVQIERKSQADCYNQVTIEYLDRANGYNVAIATAKDQASIERDGLRPADPVKMHGICTPDVAHQVAYLLLQRSLYIRNEYTFKLGWRYCLLEPMDLVTLTDEGLGLNKKPVRITSIEEDEDGELTVKAEDYPFGVASATAHPGQPSLGSGVDYSVAPGNAYTPVIFEAPLQITNNEPQIWMAAAGGGDWGGCNVWISADGNSYRRIGRLDGKSRYGTTTSVLNAGAAIDTVQQLGVDISSAGGQLIGGTHDDAEAMTTACYVGGEFIGYANAALTGPGRYNLGYLVRGGWGSNNDTHPAGSQFVRLSDPLFKHAVPADWLGRTVFIKLTSYNVFGAAEQTLDEVQAYSYTIVGAPLGAVQNITLTTTWAAGKDACIKWDALPGASSYDIEVWASTTNTRTRLVQGVVDNQFVYTPQDMRSDGGPWRSVVFRVRGRAITGKTGPWSQIVAGNPQVAALQGIKIDPGIKSGFFTYAAPVEYDFAGVQVWLSADPDCPPIPGNLVYDGPDTFITLSKLPDGTPLTGGTAYYLRAAGYDTFGKDDLAVSNSTMFEPYATLIEPNSITTTEIKDGSISTPKLAANAVTADKILANSITGDRIAANTITGQHIKAGTVSTDVLVSGTGSGNLLPNASFASQFTDSAGRKQATEWTYWTDKFTNMLYSVDFAGSAWVPPGMHGMVIYQPDKSFAGSDAVAVVYSEQIPVVAGTWYEASCYVASHRCTSRISGTFYSAAHQPVGSFFSPACPPGVSGGTDLNNYRRLFTLAQAPAGASYLRFELLHNPTEASATAPNDNSYSFFVRPYFGVATGSGQTQPSPWSAPGIGTQIHGGALKTGTVTADRMAVGSLSAISANLGYCTAGEVHGGKFHGGAFDGNYAWPASGGGFHLSEHGLLLGNANTGGYFQLQSNGDMYTPGMTLVGGTLTINQLRVIKSANIARDAISRSYSYTTHLSNPVGLTVHAHDTCTCIVSFSTLHLTSLLVGDGPNSPKLTGSLSATFPWIRSQTLGSNSQTTYYFNCSSLLIGELPAGSHVLQMNMGGSLSALLVFK